MTINNFVKSRTLLLLSLIFSGNNSTEDPTILGNYNASMIR